MRRRASIVCLLVVWSLGRGLAADPLDVQLVEQPAAAPEPLPEGAIASFGVGRFRAAGQIDSVQLSPSGEILATRNVSGLQRLWDTKTGRLIRQLRSRDEDYHKLGPRQAVDWSPDGKHLAVLDSSGQVILMHGQNCEQRNWKQPDPQVAVVLAFGPDNESLFVGSRGEVRAYAIDTGAVIQTFALGDEQPHFLAFQGDGKTLDVIASSTRQFRWNIRTGERSQSGLELDFGNVFGFGPGSVAFSADHDRISIHRSAAAGGRVSFDAGERRIEGLAMSADGRILASGDDQGLVKLWSAADQKLLAEFPSGGATNLAFARNASILATGSKWLGNRIRLWNLSRPVIAIPQVTEILPDDDHVAGIVNLQFTADGSKLLSASIDSTARMWDVAMRTELARHGNGRYSSLSADGTLLALNGLNASASRLVDPLRPEAPPVFSPANTTAAVALSPDRKRFAYLEQGKPAPIVIWDVEAKAEVTRIDSETFSAYTLHWSPDSRLLAFGGTGGKVHVWDVDQKALRLQAAEASVHYQAFTPNSRFLITGRSNLPGRNGLPLQVWNLESGKMDREFGDGQHPHSFALLADNRHLLSGNLDGNIHVWDWTTGAAVRTLPGHQTGVYALAVSPDQTLIASGSIDSAIFLWDASRVLAAPGLRP